MNDYIDIMEKGLKEETSKSFDIYNTLFSSMLTPTEFYLSSNLSKTAINTTRNSLKRTKNNLLKLLKKQYEGIEKLIDLNVLQKNINKEMKNLEMLKNNVAKALKYSARLTTSPIKNALNNIYIDFVDYGKKTYRAIEKESEKALELKPEQTGYELDIYSRRLKIIRMPKDTYGYLKEKLALYEFINPIPALWY